MTLASSIQTVQTGNGAHNLRAVKVAGRNESCGTEDLTEDGVLHLRCTAGCKKTEIIHFVPYSYSPPGGQLSSDCFGLGLKKTEAI